jgi:hypothetical protein
MKLALLVAAVICFALAAIKVETAVSLRDAGFALVTASLIV